MRSALGSLTLLFITSAQKPQSTLQPGGAVPTSANTAPALQRLQPGIGAG